MPVGHGAPMMHDHQVDQPDRCLLRAVVDGRECDVLLRQGRVAALRESSRATTLLHDGTTSPVEVVDLDGAVVLPGLRDEHAHLEQWAAARRRVDLSSASSPTQTAALMAAAVSGTPVAPGAMVMGYGFRHTLWTEPPQAALLDRVLPGRAVVLVSADLHTAWCSSAASQLLGLTAPDGVVREDEAMAVFARAGRVERELMDRWVLEALDAAAARGVTAVVDFEYADTVGDWTRRAGLAPDGPATRVDTAVWTDWLEATVAAGLRSGDPLPGVACEVAADRVRVGPLKVFVDGSLGTRTALCDAAYPGATGPERHGLLRTPQAELEHLLRRAAAAGLRTAVHAIGDRATALALDAFEQVGGGGRIEHAQQVRDADLPRFAALGVVASIQPRHALDDRDAADQLWGDGAGRAFPYGALHRAGARLVLGSDAPVAPLDPWDAIASAVHRSLDERRPWHPEQHLSLPDALAAASGGRRQVQVGDAADLTIVPDPPDRVLAAGGPHALRTMPVLATLVGGRWTHRCAALS